MHWHKSGVEGMMYVDFDDFEQSFYSEVFLIR